MRFSLHSSKAARASQCSFLVQTEVELTTLRYAPGDLGHWLDIRNAECTVYHQWDESLVGITGHDPAAHTLTLATPCTHPPGSFGENPRALCFVLWNVREGMTGPGQWYLDRTRGLLVYWRRPEEDLRIDYNLIRDYMRELDDGGAIYSFGAQEIRKGWGDGK